MDRAILHSDLNSFYASVEIMLNPRLRGKAIAVCGSTEDRHGIVLAKSELAKKAGVKTGMVNWEARAVCKDLLVVPPQYEQYLKYSKLTQATSFLARRVIPHVETLSGGISGAVRQLINDHLISPSDPDRAISFITYTDTGLTDPIATQVERQNLYEAVTALCEATDVGIKTTFNTITKGLTVSLYKGSLVHAVFAEEFENVLTQYYTQSAMVHANVAVVAGEASLITIGFETGALRREVFVDASSLKSTDLGSDYETALGFEGQSKLDELKIVHSFEVTINPHGNLTYKTDYDLGDIVTVVSKKWGVTLTVRIVEVAETYDLQGQNLEITFGRGILTLAQRLKGGR